MQRFNGHSLVLHFITDTINAHSSATENNGAPALANDFGRNCRLFGIRNKPKEMRHAFHCDFFWTNFNGHGIGLVISYQICDFIIERGAKENRLPICFALVENFADRFHETHVSHSVCFIKNNNPDIIQRYCASLKQIE